MALMISPFLLLILAPLVEASPEPLWLLNSKKSTFVRNICPHDFSRTSFIVSLPRGGDNAIDGNDAVFLGNKTRDTQDDGITADSELPPSRGGAAPTETTNPDGTGVRLEDVPPRYVRMQKGNIVKAAAAYAESLRWRQEHDVDTILDRPHPKFDAIKMIFPAFFPGKDKEGHPILVQRPGCIDWDSMKKNGIKQDELLTHYVYIIEYCWNVLNPDPEGTMTSIIDLSNLSFTMLFRRNGEMLSFVKKFVGILSAHYPQRSYKTIIINVPRWFNTAYAVIKPLLRESTKKKIEIYSRGLKQATAVRIAIDGVHIPSEILGGDASESFGDKESHGEVEKQLRELCLKKLRSSGMAMAEFVKA